MLRSCNGSREHFPDCCVRATSEARTFDDLVLTLRFCRSMDSDRRQPWLLTKHLAGDDRLEQMVAATRPEPDVARRGCPSQPGPPFAPQNSV
jgi:hypothetical protein